MTDYLKRAIVTAAGTLSKAVRALYMKELREVT
jgi:hypothetical protein